MATSKDPYSVLYKHLPEEKKGKAVPVRQFRPGKVRNLIKIRNLIG